jgi:uncharacterized membrane protein
VIDSGLFFLSLILTLVSLLGFYFAYLYGHRAKTFKFRVFLAFLGAPIICCIYLISIYGFKLIIFFVSSAIVGSILEYIVGFVYHQIFHKRLWVYSNYNLHGYVSYLGIPIWGTAGMVFWLLGKILLV